MSRYPKPTFQNGFARHKGESLFPSLWDGLEGCWEFCLGVQGQTPRDFSGYGRHGSMSAGFGTNLTWVVGSAGWGIQSAAGAGSDRITIPSLTTGTVWTWETLVKINALTDSWEQLFGGGGIGIFLRSSGLFRIEAGTGLYSNNALSAGNQYHLVATSDGSTLRIYFDTREDASGAAGTPTFNATDMLNNGSSETFDGVCYYQRFWKRALTFAEITALYRGASPLMLRRRVIVKAPAAGGSPQTVSPGGIASGQAFGTAKVNLQVRAQAIGGAEAFGTAKLNLKVVATSVSSAESFGTTKVNLKIVTSGIASAGAFGAATIVQGTRLIPSSIASGEGFGTAKLNLKVIPSGVASAQAVGNPTMVLKVSPSGIATQESVLNPRLNLRLALSGLVSLEGFGAVIVSGGGSSNPPAIDMDNVARLSSRLGGNLHRSGPGPGVRSSLSAGKTN